MCITYYSNENPITSVPLTPRSFYFSLLISFWLFSGIKFQVPTMLFPDTCPPKRLRLLIREKLKPLKVLLREPSWQSFSQFGWVLHHVHHGICGNHHKSLSSDMCKLTWRGGMRIQVKQITKCGSMGTQGNFHREQGTLGSSPPSRDPHYQNKNALT